jgi:Fe-S-cluster containining protein
MTTLTTRKPIDPTLPLNTVPDSHHNCRLCAHGCRRYDVLLTEQEARRLSLDWWRDLLEDVPADTPLVVLDAATGQYLLNKVDGRCVFLGSDNLCIIHKESGMQVKPTACQFFPLQAVQTPMGQQLSLNVGCRRLIEMGKQDAPLDTSEARRLLNEVQAVATIGETVPLTPDQDINFEELRGLCGQFSGMFTANPDLPFAEKLRQAAQFLLQLPGASPAADARAIYQEMLRLIQNAPQVRQTLTKTYVDATNILPQVIATPDTFPEVSADFVRYLVEVTRQHVFGYQFALHRTVRTGLTALLAALVYALRSGRTTSAHEFNETLSSGIDLFFSPIGALALTEPAQQAFLMALAISTIGTN